MKLEYDISIGDSEYVFDGIDDIDDCNKGFIRLEGCTSVDLDTIIKTICIPWEKPLLIRKVREVE